MIEERTLFELADFHNLDPNIVQGNIPEVGVFKAATNFAVSANFTGFLTQKILGFVDQDILEPEELKKLGLQGTEALTRTEANFRVRAKLYEKEFDKALAANANAPISSLAKALGGGLAGAFLDPFFILLSAGTSLGISSVLNSANLLNKMRNLSTIGKIGVKTATYGAAEGVFNVTAGKLISDSIERDYVPLNAFVDAAVGVVFGTALSPKLKRSPIIEPESPLGKARQQSEFNKDIQIDHETLKFDPKRIGYMRNDKPTDVKFTILEDSIDKINTDSKSPIKFLTYKIDPRAKKFSYTLPFQEIQALMAPPARKQLTYSKLDAEPEILNFNKDSTAARERLDKDLIDTMAKDKDINLSKKDVKNLKEFVDDMESYTFSEALKKEKEQRLSEYVFFSRWTLLEPGRRKLPLKRVEHFDTFKTLVHKLHHNFKLLKTYDKRYANFLNAESFDFKDLNPIEKYHTFIDFFGRSFEVLTKEPVKKSGLHVVTENEIFTSKEFRLLYEKITQLDPDVLEQLIFYTKFEEGPWLYDLYSAIDNVQAARTLRHFMDAALHDTEWPAFSVEAFVKGIEKTNKEHPGAEGLVKLLTILNTNLMRKE